VKNFCILFILLILTACKGNRDSTYDVHSDQQSAAVTCTLNWVGHWLSEDKRELLVREACKEVSFMNQDMHINLRFPQELNAKQIPQMAAFIVAETKKDTPDWDVVWLDDRIYESASNLLNDPEWGKKHLYDFSEDSQFLASQKEFIIKDPTYINHYGGILPGPFVEGFYHVLWYNVEVAKKIGITIKDFGMTIEDLLKYFEAAQRYNEAGNPYIAPFYDTKEWNLSMLLFQQILRSCHPDIAFWKQEGNKKQKLAYLRETLDIYQRMAKYEPLYRNHRNVNWFETIDFPLQDSALFYFNGTWMYNLWNSLDSNFLAKMRPAVLPEVRTTNAYLGGYNPSFAVMKKSRNLEKAKALIKYWSSPSLAEKWVRYTKNPTGVKGNVSNNELGGDALSDLMMYLEGRFKGNAYYYTNTNYLLGSNNPDLTGFIGDRLKDILEGKITSEQAYRMILERCNF